jgi:hypothetical protein
MTLRVDQHYWEQQYLKIKERGRRGGEEVEDEGGRG